MKHIFFCKDGFVIKDGSRNDVYKDPLYMLFNTIDELLDSVEEARKITFISPKN